MEIKFTLRPQIENFYSRRNFMLNRMVMPKRKYPYFETLGRKVLGR